VLGRRAGWKKNASSPDPRDGQPLGAQDGQPGRSVDDRRQARKGVSDPLSVETVCSGARNLLTQEAARPTTRCRRTETAGQWLAAKDTPLMEQVTTRSREIPETLRV
jgi:hypothetical protein